MKEKRIIELRAQDPAGENSALILTGVPIVYDAPTTINDPAGEFIEIIQRGALDGADLSDVRLLYNHDTNRVPLARTPKTMELRTTPAGLEMIATLADTADARSVYEAVKRGDLSGCSFAFTVPDGGDHYDPMTNTRIITRINKVYECSIVPFPAYPQTSVEARSARIVSLNRLQAKQKAKILINQIKKVEV